MTEQLSRKRSFEQFEQRLAMSAQAITDVGFDNFVDVPEIIQQVEVSQQLHEVNEAFGVNAVGQQFQLDGSGQTVAIIDSGIAWDHNSLGGGLGAGYRVVGGWDFAENDANPYDDGSAGFHGTHVAGIVGSSDNVNAGVASGVDLVGLRVFDDNGQGSLEWVEQALQWVHQHRDSFENPITTVNLSLGSDWNLNNVPNWATLENEFAQLQADGLFISVAAGNAFEDYNATGLSYPAVSPFVVPVASHDADGNLSQFSQRNYRVLVAPGENITSTVPDHLYAGPTHNGFLGATGTSMASPFVAGASALLRQANQFMGIDNIGQNLLYQQFRESADYIYDAATHGYYHRINVLRAIESVITDVHSDNWASATNGGTFDGDEVISGTIGSVTDTDKFIFTASRSGEMTLNFTTTHSLRAAVDVIGAQATVDGNQVRFNVTAGQEYRFSVATSDGIGHYDINVQLSEVATGKDWGLIQSNSFSETVSAGENWYQMTASHGGILTLLAQVQQTGSPMTFELYDANMNRLSFGQTEGDSARLTTSVAKNQLVSLKVTANSMTHVDFHASNVVSLKNRQLTIYGSNDNDRFHVSAGQQITINVNGMGYHFDIANVDSIQVAGGAGNDHLTATFSDHVDQATLRVGSANVTTANVSFVTADTENITLDTLTATSLYMFDSAGSDTFTNTQSVATMRGDGFSNTASGFSKIYVSASTGYDMAHLTGSGGNDYLSSLDVMSVLWNAEQNVVVKGFDGLAFVGRGGNDVANIFDSHGNDSFVLNPYRAHLTADSYQVWAAGFETISAHSNNGGFDSVQMFDSEGDDFFRQKDDQSIMRGDHFLTVANDMDWVRTYASSGRDVAQIYDTSGNDTLHAYTNKTQLVGQSKSYSAIGFDQVTAIAQRGGYDRAYLNGTAGTDFMASDGTSVTIVDANATANRVQGFDEIVADTMAGVDYSSLNGTGQRDILKSFGSEVDFQSTMQMLRLVNAENHQFHGRGGADEIIFEDIGSLDLLEMLGDRATAYLNQQRIEATDFSYLEAKTKTGETGYYDIGAVDFLFMLDGNWQPSQ